MTAVITGASRGIGAAIAEAFFRDGCNVVINYNTQKSAALALCQKLNQDSPAGNSAAVFQADISQRSDIEAMYQFTRERFGGCDVLINNAGIAEQKLFTDITQEDLQRMFDVNFFGVWNCCQVFLPEMIHRKSGSVVNISSVWGIAGASCETHYSAAKAAVIGFSKALAKEAGLSGVRVNCIAPGVISTDMNSGFSPETKSQLAESSALGKIGTPKDVAAAVLMLSQNPFITGQVLCVDGGFIN